MDFHWVGLGLLISAGCFWSWVSPKLIIGLVNIAQAWTKLAKFGLALYDLFCFACLFLVCGLKFDFGFNFLWVAWLGTSLQR